MDDLSANPQNVAADPRASCFLTANAGSGKTSTLVNRVARLLLRGAKPEHILCVTYTKAAAAEMQARLFERLGHWAVAEDDELARQLAAIDENPHDLATARALFAKALETPGGLKIQTIHAFCERLLRRFPLEAGLSPTFEILDDFRGQALSERASADLLTLDLPALTHTMAARARLIVRLKAAGFEKLLAQFVYQHDDLAEAFDALQSRHKDWPRHLFNSLGLDAPCTTHECLEAYADRIEWRIITDLAGSLSTGGTKTNQEAGRALLDLHMRWRDDGVLDFECLKAVFFTKAGELRKSPYAKETSPSDAILLDRLSREVVALADRLKAVDIASNTLDALRLFAVFSKLFTTAKRNDGALDFQDLITRTRTLLDRHLMSAWVLFKLDGGLEHILVDEAQDTSGDQWAILRPLTEEFLAGAGQSRVDPRTVFAVGDEKQSIYGFQGADPAQFLDQGRYYERRVNEAGQTFVAPSLTQSWRSLPEILGFVDAVFDAPELATALNFTGDPVVHQPKRSEAPGFVELWPRVLPIDAPEANADEEEDVAALDEPGRAHPAKRLARQIAVTIRHEIDAGRTVWDRTSKARRPMHAGDVLILVRKRDLLFEHVIRELKIAGVAVSGADRLKLGEHIAFQDLRALMRFCLTPRDDLSLACVLRSPMCDVSEDELFTLANGRTGPLWNALWNIGGDEGAFADARVFLRWAITASQRLTAFDFLSRVLNRRDAGGRSLKQRFLTRLGDECEDVLDETLQLALKGEGAGAIGLSAALDLFEFHATEIKREQEEGGRSVRVMTVHGSKGLEAPWVILPVGPQHRSSRRDDLLLTSGDGELYLSAGGKKAEVEAVSRIRARITQREEQEALRLFYVAVTRARDRLTICGFAGKRAQAKGLFPGWYEMADAGFDRLDAGAETMDLAAPFDEMDMREIAVIRTFGERPPVMAAEARLAAARVVLPDFVTQMPVKTDMDSEIWQAISQMGDEDRAESDPSPSPLETRNGLGRYRRGNLIHKLFEMLPDIRPDNRETIARRYLERQSDLNDDQRDEIRSAVMTVLDDTRFAEAFGPDSRAEVALAGQVGTNAAGAAVMLSGRIDRLVVTPDRVLVIDYKSNRPAPDHAEDAAIAYQRQMAGYVGLLRQVYPDREVSAALLWTDGPKLTPLSETLVNLRLAEISSR
ncbi:double-strand break repair helicase AddA [Asticcacaulis solisilvae]|uniref:double-strand break repair helicase AddA n=1 Tax=Asticcacaulis solisilvae TaxID=1217274 RepID=UPI003FD8828C